MWPLLAKMATEARNSKESWAKRGIRTIIMYPMNALVSDQVSRLRRMIGDPDKKYSFIQGSIEAVLMPLGTVTYAGDDSINGF